MAADAPHHEDRVIGDVLTGLEDVARRLDAGHAVPLLLLEAAVDFLGAFLARYPDADVKRVANLRASIRRGVEGDRRALAAALREWVGFLRGRSMPVAADGAGVGTMSREARAALLDLGEAVVAACRQALPAPAGQRAVAGDLMRAAPRLAPDQSLASAARLMETLDVRALPVVAHGRLVGLLARRDLRPHEGHWEWTTVETAMTHDPVTVTPETPLPAVARLLLAQGFNAVPVAVGGVALGMIARVDLLRVVAGDR
jgi:CBS domain-containing protein